jgi:uncharacterized protein
VRVADLIVEPGRAEQIDRHRVSLAEGRQVIEGNPLWIRTRQRRYRLLGQTDAGRYLTVILAPRGSGVFSLVTARDATDPERRAYRAHRRS